MNRREYHRVNKAEWGEGPWLSEPDKVQFRDPETGYPCLVNRGPMGALCGYVGVPKGHPYHGREWDNIDVAVHGGVTFAKGCQHSEDPAFGVCHIPDPGEPDDVWWIGFDCAHFQDLIPEMNKLRRQMPELQILYKETEAEGYPDTYKTLGWVEAEIADLAKQLKEVADRGQT